MYFFILLDDFLRYIWNCLIFAKIYIQKYVIFSTLSFFTNKELLDEIKETPHLSTCYENLSCLNVLGLTNNETAKLGNLLSETTNYTREMFVKENNFNGEDVERVKFMLREFVVFLQFPIDQKTTENVHDLICEWIKIDRLMGLNSEHVDFLKQFLFQNTLDSDNDNVIMEHLEDFSCY